MSYLIERSQKWILSQEVNIVKKFYTKLFKRKKESNIDIIN